MLELIDTTYVAFRDRVEGIIRHTTCECNACRAIPTLDLKFMVHFGEYVVQHISGINELVGSDVNLLHRLTKNQVSDSTGWHAYACFSRVALEHLNIQPGDMHEQIEKYEHLGEVTTYNLDLRNLYKEITDNRRFYVEVEESDYVFTMDVAVPQPVLWEWMTDPDKRNLYMSDVKWSAVSRSGGRIAVGSQNHCAHGDDAISVETVLDWKPFDYFTVERDNKMGEETMMDTIQTSYFEPINGDTETRFHLHVKLKIRNLISRFMLKMFAKKITPIYDQAAEMIRQEMLAQEKLPLESAFLGSPAS